MKSEEFFNRHIFGYLLCDLKEMDKIKVKGYGGCGYPMLMTIVSGCELLGGLLFPQKWTSSKDKEYFLYFIDRYLPQYKEHADTIWRHGRNKLDHMYLTSSNLFIYKNNKNKSLKIDNHITHLNVRKFFQDFERAVKLIWNELNTYPELKATFDNNLKQATVTHLFNDALREQIFNSAKYSSLASTSVTTASAIIFPEEGDKNIKGS